MTAPTASAVGHETPAGTPPGPRSDTPPVSAELLRWWSGRRGAARVAVAATGLLVGAAVILGGVGATFGSGGGAASSSLSTAPDGYAALASLLRQEGQSVVVARQRLDQIELPGRATVVVADSVLSSGEVAALSALVDRGGRAILAGSEQEPLRRLVSSDVRWVQGAPPGSAQPTGPASPLTEGIGTVAVGGDGFFGAVGPATVVLADAGLPIEAVDPKGRGEIVMLAESSALSDALLGDDDNALLALDAVGTTAASAPATGAAGASGTTRPTVGTVVFAEAGHVGGSGLAALPTAWRFSLVIAVLAWLAWLWSAGSRLSPPVKASADLTPARRLYVDSLAVALARAGDPGPIVERLRNSLPDPPAYPSPAERASPEAELMELAVLRVGTGPE